MRRTLATLAILAGLAAGACGEAPHNNIIGPSAVEQHGSMASVADISCSDAAPQWKTKNYSPSGRGFTADWFAAAGGVNTYTYEVEVRYSRDGLEAVRLIGLFRTNQSNARVSDTEDGGRYYVRVRIVHNPCGDVDGPWSVTLTVYLDGRADNTGPPPTNEEPPIPPVEPPAPPVNPCEPFPACLFPPPPPPPQEPPPSVDDHDNGHGNDDDHDDDSNPGHGHGHGH